jgi:hypothetical protein
VRPTRRLCPSSSRARQSQAENQELGVLPPVDTYKANPERQIRRIGELDVCLG